MRTKEQIQELLTSVKFTDEALAKILGFMIGKGLKEEKEQMAEISKRVIDGVKAWATIGADRAMNTVNTKPKQA